VNETGPHSSGPGRLSVFAWQVNDVVREIESDFVERKIGVLDLLLEHGLAVAILATERRGAVGSDFQFPYVERLAAYGLVVRRMSAISSSSQ
jgi:hypothetical protein